MGRLEPEKILQAALKALDGVKDDVEDHAARLSQGRLAPPTPHVVAAGSHSAERGLAMGLMGHPWPSRRASAAANNTLIFE